MPEDVLDYKTDTSIDTDALDVEWLQQAELMRRYASYAAETKRYMDELKERLDVLRAQLDMDIRKDPEKFGIGKITESVVQSTILVQPEYQKLADEYREARYENDIAIAAVRAIDQKKTALENLVRLLTANYFAGPVTPRDLSREWVERNERRQTNKRVRLKRREAKEREEE